MEVTQSLLVGFKALFLSSTSFQASPRMKCFHITNIQNFFNIYKYKYHQVLFSSLYRRTWYQKVVTKMKKKFFLSKTPLLFENVKIILYISCRSLVIVYLWLDYFSYLCLFDYFEFIVSNTP